MKKICLYCKHLKPSNRHILGIDYECDKYDICLILPEASDVIQASNVCCFEKKEATDDRQT